MTRGLPRQDSPALTRTQSRNTPVSVGFAVCGAPVPVRSGAGRQRRWCDDRWDAKKGRSKVRDRRRGMRACVVCGVTIKTDLETLAPRCAGCRALRQGRSA
jgi:hypothetical protein